ncbi:MAG: ATP-binding protein [Actinomycetota bacterium]
MGNLTTKLTAGAAWRFDPSPDQLPAARHALRAWLDSAGFAPEVAEDAVLVAAELIGNGVLHDGGGPITVRAAREPGQLRIEVLTIDHPFVFPPPWLERLRSPFHDEGGLGLKIVEALTCHLAIDRHDGARRVSCALPVEPECLARTHAGSAR